MDAAHRYATGEDDDSSSRFPEVTKAGANAEPFGSRFAWEIGTESRARRYSRVSSNPKEEDMHRREFITAAVGTAAAVASASQAFAQDYPDFGAIKKVPAGEGQAGAASKGIEGEAGAPKKGIIEKITEAIGGGEMEQMHPPKYNALEKTSIECVAMGNDCLRHCLGMFAMKDTSMSKCADTAFQLVAGCSALASLAAVNSEHTAHLAKVVEMLCNDCKKECDNFPKIVECRACGDACKACADECRKVAS